MEKILYVIVLLINKIGYVGIFTVTALEYACFPLSSEILLPFIGFSVYKGNLNLFLTVVVCTLGSISGSLFCYFFGRFCGNFMYGILGGKSESIKETLSKSEEYFLNKGKYSVLFARLVPLLRTYISFPAGIFKMNIKDFSILTFIGAFIWNFVLVFIGYFLGENYIYVKKWFSENNRIILFFTIAILIFFVIKRSKRK